MAKRKKTNSKPPVSAPLPKVILPWWQQQNVLLATLIIIALGFYFNTLFNQYALDDVISITMNSFTKKGLHGIPDLLWKDSFYGFIGNASDLSGGRWRPLALVTFATEIHFFGMKPFVPHLDNLLLFALTVAVMFLLLSEFIFRTSPIAAFVATFLYVIHPIHTEVIANIKSRDELLSFLFLLLTLYLSLQYMLQGRKVWKLLLSLLCYFLALLSKENGVTFIAILPLTFYCFTKEKLGRILSVTLPFAGVAVFYMLLRVKVIGYTSKNITEVMNAPYLYATDIQAFATKILVLGKYIILLFYPYKLNYDYSYHQIPYTSFADWRVWLSIIVQIGLLVYAFIKLGQRSIFSYGILFYFFSIFIVSNFIVDTGGVLGERFLFQASFGFCICLAALARLAFSKLSSPFPAKISLAGVLLVILLCLGGYKTISRNRDWKNDKVLYVVDARTNPNSARTNNGAGTSFINLSDEEKDPKKKQALLDSAVYHLRLALKIHPKYVDPWLNLGVVFNRMGDVYMAEAMWDSARVRSPNHPKLMEFDGVLAQTFYNNAMRSAAAKNFTQSLHEFYKSLQYGPNTAATWYDLGGEYYTLNRFDSARICWNRALQLEPSAPGARQGLNALNARGL